MNRIPEKLLSDRHRYLPMLKRLQGLFEEMDQVYASVAEQYGFRCMGCENNCCLTRFYHHTLLEVLYLAEGMRTLPTDTKQAFIRQARAVERQTAAAAERSESGGRRMCPLNQEGRCMIYAYRPMICRLHGIPHELHRPNGGVIKNPGCDAFFDQCQKGGKKDYIQFDRTPFYRKMALLEGELRRATGYAAKIKLTIAQMLMTIMETAHEID